MLAGTWRPAWRYLCPLVLSSFFFFPPPPTTKPPPPSPPQIHPPTHFSHSPSIPHSAPFFEIPHFAWRLFSSPLTSLFSSSLHRRLSNCFPRTSSPSPVSATPPYIPLSRQLQHFFSQPQTIAHVDRRESIFIQTTEPHDPCDPHQLFLFPRTISSPSDSQSLQWLPLQRCGSFPLLCSTPPLVYMSMRCLAPDAAFSLHPLHRLPAPPTESASRHGSFLSHHVPC